MTGQKEKYSHLFIKNMVCNRCIKVVKEELNKLGLNIKNISLGEVITETRIDENLLPKIKTVLMENGFELIESKRAKLVEKIKNIVISKIQDDNSTIIKRINYSAIIEKEAGHEYTYLSSLFSSIEGITIEHFIILQKIERAKELLKYGELTLSEIAYKLGYSSVQHLSNQFRKVTGLSASSFRNLTINLRKPLDKLG
ncbi:MAG: helix-turn-helix transcriptional regulator [Bacteroidota bacterium]